MKPITRILLLALVITTAIYARAQDRVYAVIEYMHVPEDQSEEAYLAIEKLWQRLHQKAVDSGICLAWFLERVENGGRAHFATIRLYNSLDKMAEPWPDSIWKDLYTSEEMNKMQQTGRTRDLIQSELWQVEASAIPQAGGDPSSYISVQFMKPKRGKAGEYYNLEKNTYSKIHAARVKAGEMRNWHFLSRMFPGGTDAPYDFVTINVFANKDYSWNPKTVETALGQEEAAKLGNPALIRTMVREEVWHPVLGTRPAKK